MIATLLPTLIAVAAVSSVLAPVLQLTSFAAACGTAVALRAKRRWGAEPWPIVATWSTAGLVAGICLETVSLIAN